MSEAQVSHSIAFADQPSRLADEENRVWSYLYHKTIEGDATTAAELIKVFEANPSAKALRLGLYTLAQSSMRRHENTRARRQRVAGLVKLAYFALFVRPWRLVRTPFAFAGGVILQLVPAVRAKEPVKEPAKRRFPSIKSDRDVAKALEALQGSAAQPATAVQDESSRSSKAA